MLNLWVPHHRELVPNFASQQSDVFRSCLLACARRSEYDVFSPYWNQVMCSCVLLIAACSLIKEVRMLLFVSASLALSSFCPTLCSLRLSSFAVQLLEIWVTYGILKWAPQFWRARIQSSFRVARRLCVSFVSALRYSITLAIGFIVRIALKLVMFLNLTLFYIWWELHFEALPFLDP
jgi:hypothetical protein